MRIMGVDPGLKATGYGVLDLDSAGRFKPIEVGTIEPKANTSLAIKLQKIKKHLDDIILRQKPNVMVIEKLYSHYAHPITAVIMGHARGVICLACVDHGVELVEESPKRIRKAVVGNGNASKEQTRSVVARILKLDASKLSLDASDALALSIGYANMKRLSS